MMRYAGRFWVESTRLPGYDYASAGWYHVVLCTKDRACWFGEVVHGIVGLSELGATAHRFCAGIPDHFGHVVLDAFVVMPNHVHVIIGLLSPPVETLHATSLRPSNTSSSRPHALNHGMSDISPRAGSAGVIVRSYKSAITRRARRNAHVDFAWQPRFYDRVVRSERELHALRRYVLDNPPQWALDRYHPDRRP